MLTEAQLRDRQHYIGGSDVGSILGLNKYRSPLDVYLEKTGEIKPPDLSGNPAVHWGNRLEDLISDEYAVREGVRVRRRNKPIRLKDANSWAGANLDRSVDGQRKVFEAKTAGQYMTKDWGEEGTDEVPDTYLTQVHWYMGITGYQKADLAVLIGGRDFRIYRFDFDAELFQMAFDRCDAFWHRHVLRRTPPAPTCERDLQTLYAVDNGRSVVASEGAIEWHASLVELKKEIKQLEAKKKDLEFALKSELEGNAELLVSPDGAPLVTWKSPKSGKRLNGKALKESMPEIWDQFAPVTQGSRRFLVK